MSVRWKPLVLLTGLFVMLAVMGLFAFTRVLFPARAEDLLPLARAEAKAGKFDRAKIQYQRALQRDTRNAQIHLELARMIEAWVAAQPQMKEKLQQDWLSSVQGAARHGKQLTEPRRMLLSDALQRGEWGDCVFWSRELVAIDKSNLDARYVLACEALDAAPANISESRGHLSVLEAKEPKRVRTLWLKARLAQAANEDAELDALLTAARLLPRAGTADDRLCGVRLRAMDIERAADDATLAERMAAFRAEVAELATSELPPARGRELLLMLQRLQQHLGSVARSGGDRAALDTLKQALSELAETTFQQAAKSSGGNDLRPHQSYAELLLYGGQRDRCLAVVGEALKLPVAGMPFWVPTGMELREIGIKAALLDSTDTTRFAKAEGWIQELQASGNPRYRALGHLFQGVIELELSGLADAVARDEAGAPAKGRDERRAASAISHLKQAAEGLKDVSTAQALYGVGLLLSGEPALGRQYLQQALQSGGKLDPRYQIWAALSVMHAGYPEDAQPIVDALLGQVSSGEVPQDLEGTLHLINAEIHQSRETPAELKLAFAEYQKALAAGYPRTAAFELRMAHLAAMMGDNTAAFQTIDKLSQDAQSGPSAERVAALALHQKGNTAEAIKRLDAARTRYPDSAELYEVSALMLNQSGDPKSAEILVSQYLARHPNDEAIALVRVKLLAESLNRGDEARAMLTEICEKSKSSTPWILMAHLELGRKDFASASKAIAHIRTRWPEASAADLLDAQIALTQGQLAVANGHLAAALKKDPSNKVARFWKGRLDELTGSTAEAQAIFEQLAKERPLKEIESGVSLGTAAQWALAAMALERQQYDVAASRYEAILREATSDEVARPARWNLALARAGLGQVNEARADVAALVRDPRTTPEERVQAADFFRRNGDDKAAAAQIDLVLKDQPQHPGAVTYRALMLLEKEQQGDALRLVSAAVAAGKAPPGLYLLQAAIENQAGPTGLPRALAVLDAGIKSHPDHVELWRARYQIMTLMRDENAVTLLEREATARPEGPAAQALIEAYRDRGEFEKAIGLVDKRLEMLEKNAAATRELQASRVGLQAARAAQAAQRGDAALERRLMGEAQATLTAARKVDPTHLPYLQLEGELALQARDFARAHRLAEELTDRDASSPEGPVLSARIAQAEGRLQEVASAYEKAVERKPGRADLRLALARSRMANRQFDDAVVQASHVLDLDRDSTAAQFVKAQALAQADGTPQQVRGNREKAIAILRGLIRRTPTAIEPYHLLSDLLLLTDDRAGAIALLETCLNRVPTDDAAVSLLVQRLCEPAAAGRAAAEADVRRAQKVAGTFTANDERGVFHLAVAVGLHRAGRPDLALPYVQRAAEILDQPMVHLTAGDILLACAERNVTSAEARDWFTEAVRQYDSVIARRPDLIEAINNKAWILHRYLDRNAEALQLATAAADRIGAGKLPPDFLDTLGAIQEAAGKKREAEASYNRGLRMAPEHPILNYHMARLLTRAGKDKDRAKACLEKANQARADLPADIVQELEQLGREIES